MFLLSKIRTVVSNFKENSKPPSSFSEALRQGISLGILLARKQPEKSHAELMAEIEDLQKQLKALPTKELKKIASK